MKIHPSRISHPIIAGPYSYVYTVIYVLHVNLTGLTLPAIFLLMCGYFGNSVEWAIVFLSLSVGCSGFAVAGFPVNNLDIAPKYAGILLGISNMMGTIPGFLGPQIAKLIAKKASLFNTVTVAM